MATLNRAYVTDTAHFSGALGAGTGYTTLTQASSSNGKTLVSGFFGTISGATGILFTQTAGTLTSAFQLNPSGWNLNGGTNRSWSTAPAYGVHFYIAGASVMTFKDIICPKGWHIQIYRPTSSAIDYFVTVETITQL